MKKIYFVGAATEVKGIHDFNELAKKHPKAQFYWFCYRISEELKQHYSNTIFMEGLNDEDMKKQIKKMDLLICLSRFEGFCLPIAEAILYNKPVISFDLDEIESVFKNNIQYVKNFNLNLFNEKLSGFIYDGIYTKNTNKAKDYVVLNFSPKKVKERFFEIIS